MTRRIYHFSENAQHFSDLKLKVTSRSFSSTYEQRTPKGSPFRDPLVLSELWLYFLSRTQIKSQITQTSQKAIKIIKCFGDVKQCPPETIAEIAPANAEPIKKIGFVILVNFRVFQLVLASCFCLCLLTGQLFQD